MEIEISKIISGRRTNIGILLYIKNNIIIEREISRVRSGGDSDIVLNDYFQNSLDFKKLANKIDIQRQKVDRIFKNSGNSAAYEVERHKLEQLNMVSVRFRESALRLAQTFLDIKNESKKLRQARILFEQGSIREADKCLLEEDLDLDQVSLIAQFSYLKQRKLDLSALLDK